jgi:tetratricopeptide (TPR) repeat protein
MSNRNRKEVRQLRDLIETDRRELGDDNEKTLTDLTSLACAYREAGNYEGARALLEEVLSTRTRLAGAEDHETLKVANLLGRTLQDAGQLELAKAIQERILEAVVRQYGNMSDSAYVAMANLSGTLYALGEYEESIKLEEQILESRIERSGRSSPDAVKSTARTAKAKRALGQLEQARELDEKAVRVLEESHADAALVIGAKRGLLEDLTYLGEWEDAKDLAGEIFESARRDLSRDDEFRRHLTKHKRQFQKAWRTVESTKAELDSLE